jgi:hypothetical protein
MKLLRRSRSHRQYVAVVAVLIAAQPPVGVRAQEPAMAGPAPGSLLLTESLRLDYRVLDEDGRDMLTEGTLSIEPAGDGSLRTAWRANGSSKEAEDAILDRRFGTVWWRSHYPDTGYDFVGQRTGDTVVVEGLFEGRPARKELIIDDRPFYFDWKLGLVDFVRSGEDKRQFWVLRPDNQKMYAFEARREDMETILVAGERVPAARVNWGLTGIRRPFYHGDMWFRAEDGVFLRGEQAGRITELIAR